MSSIPTAYTGQNLMNIIQQLQGLSRYGARPQQNSLAALGAGVSAAQPTGSGDSMGTLQKIWEGLRDPRVAAFMLAASNRLANPQIGENRIGHFSNALTQGFQTVGALQALQEARRRQAEQDALARREQARRELATTGQLEGQRVQLQQGQERIHLTQKQINQEAARAERQEKAIQDRYEKTMSLNRRKLALTRKGQKNTAAYQRRMLEMQKAQTDLARARIEADTAREKARIKREGLATQAAILDTVKEQASSTVKAVIDSHPGKEWTVEEIQKLSDASIKAAKKSLGVPDVPGARLTPQGNWEVVYNGQTFPLVRTQTGDWAIKVKGKLYPYTGR